MNIAMLQHANSTKGPLSTLQQDLVESKFICQIQEIKLHKPSFFSIHLAICGKRSLALTLECI